MKKQLFDACEMVKIVQSADFKYNNMRAGSIGEVYDVYYSDMYDSYVYEVEFGGNYQLIHEQDLISNEM
jgi:hypothetical protein